MFDFKCYSWGDSKMVIGRWDLKCVLEVSYLQAAISAVDAPYVIGAGDQVARLDTVFKFS